LGHCIGSWGCLRRTGNRMFKGERTSCPRRLVSCEEVRRRAGRVRCAGAGGECRHDMGRHFPNRSSITSSAGAVSIPANGTASQPSAMSRTCTLLRRTVCRAPAVVRSASRGACHPAGAREYSIPAHRRQDGGAGYSGQRPTRPAASSERRTETPRPGGGTKGRRRERVQPSFRDGMERRRRKGSVW
jgi:hypothetical protein